MTNDLTEIRQAAADALDDLSEEARCYALDVIALADRLDELRTATDRVWDLNPNEHQRSHDHHHEYKRGYADGIKAAQAAANGDTDE